MMTPQETRELLELAAYAIGLRGKQLADGTIAYSEFGRFNSLTNKADAFDLMVKLGLDVFGSSQLYVWAEHDVCVHKPDKIAKDNNPEAATMLAITRAAAAIGKQMKARNGNAE